MIKTRTNKPSKFNIVEIKRIFKYNKFEKNFMPITSKRYIPTNKLGGHMRIKFKRLENISTKPNASGKSYPMIRVIGEALEGQLSGQEWSTKFFPSSKDMHTVAKQAKVNDILDITMKKNGLYLNPVTIEILDPSIVQVDNKVQVSEKIFVSKATERKDNLSIATSIMGPKKVKDDPVDYLNDAASIADLVEDYANETGAFQFSKDIVDNDIPKVVETVPNTEDVEEVPI